MCGEGVKRETEKLWLKQITCVCVCVCVCIQRSISETLC